MEEVIGEMERSVGFSHNHTIIGEIGFSPKSLPRPIMHCGYWQQTLDKMFVRFSFVAL